MTYRELLETIDEFEDDQLDMPVMVDVDDEFYHIDKITVQDKDDRVPDGQPYFTLTT